MRSGEFSVDRSARPPGVELGDVATYRLTVRGRLGPQVLAKLDEVIVERADARSVYVIETVDQADLYGAIDVLQSAGVELVSVVEVDPGG